MQFNSPNSSVSSQAGLGLGVQAPGLGTVAPTTLQQQLNSIHQQSNQQALMSSGPKEAGNLHLYSDHAIVKIFSFYLLALFRHEDTLISSTKN